MVDKKIKRFCELVSEINRLNKELDRERENFYDGGMSFEECNEYIINQLIELQNEFKGLVKEIKLT